MRLTVRPLLVTVHFILMKKSRSVDISLLFFPKPEPEWTRVWESVELVQTTTFLGNLCLCFLAVCRLVLAVCHGHGVLQPKEEWYLSCRMHLKPCLAYGQNERMERKLYTKLPVTATSTQGPWASTRSVETQRG